MQVQVQQTQEGHLVVMNSQGVPIYVASRSPQVTVNNGIIYVCDYQNQWAPVGQQGGQPQAAQIPQGYPQQAAQPVQIPIGGQPQQQHQPRQNVHHQNPYLIPTKDDPRLSSVGKVSTIVRGQQPQQQTAPVPSTAELNAHYAVMAQGQSVPPPQQEPVQQQAVQQQPVQPTPVAESIVVTKKTHTVGTYLLNAFTGKLGDLEDDFPSLRAFQMAITLNPSQLRDYVEELYMDAKRHATLYPAGTGDTKALSTAAQLESLPEVLTELDNVTEGDTTELSSQSSYYTIARYNSIETPLGDQAVITAMSSSLETMFDVLNGTYDTPDVELSTRIEIRGLDTLLTNAVNMYLKHMLKLGVQLDSVRMEYASLVGYASEGAIPGLNEKAIEQLSTFILQVLSFNSASSSAIAEEEDPAIYIDLHCVEIDHASSALGLSVNESPVTDEASSVICSKVLLPAVFEMLEAPAVEQGASTPAMQLLRTRDCDYTALNVDGGWIIVDTPIA